MWIYANYFEYITEQNGTKREKKHITGGRSAQKSEFVMWTTKRTGKTRHLFNVFSIFCRCEISWRKQFFFISFNRCVCICTNSVFFFCFTVQAFFRFGFRCLFFLCVLSIWFLFSCLLPFFIHTSHQARLVVGVCVCCEWIPFQSVDETGYYYSEYR